MTTDGRDETTTAGGPDAESATATDADGTAGDGGSGERKQPVWGEDAAVRRSERPFGGFRRALRMPVDVRVEDVKARLEEGILTVTLPRQTDKKSRKVDIEG